MIGRSDAQNALAEMLVDPHPRQDRCSDQGFAMCRSPSEICAAERSDAPSARLETRPLHQPGLACLQASLRYQTVLHALKGDRQGRGNLKRQVRR